MMLLHMFGREESSEDARPTRHAIGKFLAVKRFYCRNSRSFANVQKLFIKQCNLLPFRGSSL